MTASQFVSPLSPFRGPNATVVAMVAARAAQTPDAPALIAAGESLTYGELDRKANQLANLLRTLSVKSDVLVGLCLPRSLDFVVGALGVLKAGGAYVPMDPAYPAERLAFMLDDVRAPVVLSTPQLAERLRGPERSIVFLDDQRIGDQPSEPPEVAPVGADLAYVIYTSGSTGRPKGVEITHDNLLHLVRWHTAAFSLTASDRTSQVAGLGFDATVWELWPSLATGASVHLADEDVRNSAELLRAWLLARRITVSFVPTPLAEQMLGMPWPPTADLRLLLTGGDRLHRYPPPGLPFELINNYGPTECTVVATSAPVPPQATSTSAPAIGRAITGAEIVMLDDQLRPVPSGEPGEICIGGGGVARGYHGRPELTAQRFVPSPFANSGARLYRTGDRGRVLPDGQIAFLGRVDDQIKIRGYRIEPAEISTVLDSHPAVVSSLVVAREDTADNKRLVAYVVLHDGSDPGYSELRAFLGEVLPEYMLPAAFVRLERLPLTAHGKIDRTALPAPDSDNTLRDQSEEGPRSETEQRVAEIVGGLLELEEIDPDDNFFMLGGHSLLGAQVIARLRETFGVEMSLRNLFQAPTVAALSAEVDRLVAK